jgi:aquaporin related protein
LCLWVIVGRECVRSVLCAPADAKLTPSVFYRFTGSIFNPSVSLALCIVGAIKPVRFLRKSAPFLIREMTHVIVVSTGQMLGGIVASAILDALTPGPLAVGVALGQGANRTQG